MKTKRDFVTNSSSTSFIISSTPDIDIGEVEIMVPIKIKTLLSESLTNVVELNKYWDEWYGTEIETGEKRKDDEQYLEQLAIIEKGGHLHIIHATNEGEPEEALICERGIFQSDFKDQGVRVIQGEGGF